MGQDMKEFPPTGPVALAWRWALTGEGPTPISLMKWTKGPPSRESMLFESRCLHHWPAGQEGYAKVSLKK